MVSDRDTARGLHAPKYDGRVGRSARAGIDEPDCIARPVSGSEHDGAFIDRLPARNVLALQANILRLAHERRYDQ